MKLAFCLFNYFPYGGLQRDFLRIAKACVDRGHRVHVYTMRWEGAFDPDISVTLLPSQGWQNHTRLKQFSDAVQQKINAETEPYDLVIGFNKMPGLNVYYAADTCFQAKARSRHGAWYRALPRYRLLTKFEKAVFEEKSKTEILLISANEQALFTHFYETPASRFHLLPPGIAKDRMAPVNANEIRKAWRQTHDIKDEDFLVLCVGSGFKTKGLDRVIAGIAALPLSLKKQVTLFVVGQDNPRSFQEQATREGIASQIHFLGGRDDVTQCMLSADLLAHPAYYENTGTVLLEALIAGLPVLTTDVCGYAHYIQEADGGIVQASPFQQTQFNHLLQEMLMSSKRKEWKQSGIAFGQRADIYSMPERAAVLIESFAS